MNFNKLQEYELSNTDIQKIVGKIQIIKYPNLKKYKSLDELLNNKFNAVVIFYETQSSNVGHFTCAFKNNGVINYFDPYGLSAMDDLKHISQTIKIQLKEVTPYLPKLMQNAVNNGESVIINKTDYQQWKSDVSTCGRHTSVRLLNKNLNDKQYYEYLSNYKKKHKLPTFDDCVVDITYKILGK